MSQRSTTPTAGDGQDVCRRRGPERCRLLVGHGYRASRRRHGAPLWRVPDDRVGVAGRAPDVTSVGGRTGGHVRRPVWWVGGNEVEQPLGVAPQDLVLLLVGQRRVLGQLFVGVL